MTSEMSPNQRLAETLLDKPIGQYIAEKRTTRPRWSWRLIAEQLREDTNGQVDVTGETLRGWYGIEAAA